MASTTKKVKARFEAEGVSIAQWARAQGFNVAMVYRVLDGRSKGTRGEAHRIAVSLGLKERPKTAMFSEHIAA